MRGESNIVKQLLTKAKDSAMLAIEFYNKPAVNFKSEGFITMMCIAWTSLFHAYFFKNNQFYQFRDVALKEHPELVHIRILDKKKPKSNSKKFYRKELVEIIKEKYNNINNDK